MRGNLGVCRRGGRCSVVAMRFINVAYNLIMMKMMMLWVMDMKMKVTAVIIRSMIILTSSSSASHVEVDLLHVHVNFHAHTHAHCGEQHGRSHIRVVQDKNVHPFLQQLRVLVVVNGNTSIFACEMRWD